MTILKCASTKDFMNQFLMKELFDLFLLLEAGVVVATAYHIDGRIQKSFYTQEEIENGQIPYEFAAWQDMKAMVVQMIKGKHTPVSMKIVLMLKPELASEILQKAEVYTDSIKGLVCNVKYETGIITITTGVSLEGFSLDKTPEKVWDQYMKDFLSKAGIEFEEL